MNTRTCGQKVGPRKDKKLGRQYSLEEKERAIQLFQILGHYTWVIAELGYPSRTMLHYWIKEYRRTGKIEVANKTRSKYTIKQRKRVSIPRKTEHLDRSS